MRSAIDLAGFVPWPAGQQAAGELTLRRGIIARGTVREEQDLADITLCTDGAAVIAAPRVGRFRVSGGALIIADLNDDVTPGDLRTAILGPVLGMLAYQRGQLPLHANSVVVKGRLIAIAGGSGVGKSTLAATLVERGHRLFADDVMPVIQDGDTTTALPGSHYLRLGADSLAYLAKERGTLTSSMSSGRSKYHVATPAGPANGPLRLSALVRLARGRAADAEPRPLRGVYRARAIVQALYRRPVAFRLVGQPGRPNSDISLPGVAVYEYRRSAGLDRLAHDADLIERLADGLL